MTMQLKIGVGGVKASGNDPPAHSPPSDQSCFVFRVCLYPISHTPLRMRPRRDTRTVLVLVRCVSSITGVTGQQSQQVARNCLPPTAPPCHALHVISQIFSGGRTNPLFIRHIPSCAAGSGGPALLLGSAAAPTPPSVLRSETLIGTRLVGGVGRLTRRTAVRCCAGPVRAWGER